MKHSDNELMISSVNSILYEFDIQKIESVKALGATLLAEVVLWGAMKASVNKLLKKSRKDHQLSKGISDLVNIDYEIRIIQDDRIFSFHDDDKIIWISKGLKKLLTNDELIGTILHEIGHGEKKLKILYDKITKSSKHEDRRLKPLFKLLAKIIKDKGVRSDPLMMTKVYLLTYIFYISLVGNPFKGLYKWSYGDLSIQYGFWDEYESALYKINKYIRRQKKSKTVEKIAEREKKDPGTSEKIEKDLVDSMDENSDNIDDHVDKILKNKKEKPKKSILRKVIRSIF